MVNNEFFSVISDNCILSEASSKNIDICISEDCVSADDFAAGTEIFSPKQCKKCVGIIVSGTAAVLPASGADNAMLKILCKGDMFGISNLYSEDLPFPSIIIAKSSCRVLFISSNAFMKLIETDRDALRAYLTLLNDKIGYLNKKISTLTAGSTERKLALYLCSNECSGELIQPLSMSSLADILNVGRASLYRALDTLIAQGLIAKDGKKIIILDKNALLNF